MEGLQVGGTSPAPGLPLASCPLTSGSATPAGCGTPENRTVPRPGVAVCPLLGHQGLQIQQILAGHSS